MSATVAEALRDARHALDNWSDAGCKVALRELVAALSAPPAEDVREAQLRELHHFEVEQQLAELLAAVERARTEVDGVEWTDESWRHHREAVGQILSTIKRDIPTGVVRPRGTVTDAEVEAAARALFEDPMVTGDGYTWAEMVADDPSRADIWRAEARRILEAAAGVVSAGLPATVPAPAAPTDAAEVGAPSGSWVLAVAELDERERCPYADASAGQCIERGPHERHRFSDGRWVSVGNEARS